MSLFLFSFRTHLIASRAATSKAASKLTSSNPSARDYNTQVSQVNMSVTNTPIRKALAPAKTVSIKPIKRNYGE